MARVTRSTWIVLVVILVVGFGGWYLLHRPSGHVVMRFADRIPDAVEARPRPDVFSVIEATIAGDTKHAIFASETSRIAWRVTVPDHAWLVVSTGMLEKGWNTPGDGVLFRISANDDELLNLVMNPYATASDRQWHDLKLDLSEYAGETINLYLKTNASPPVPPGHNDPNGDFAVWGDPRLVTE
jgi:hypothetical protein